MVATNGWAIGAAVATPAAGARRSGRSDSVNRVAFGRFASGVKVSVRASAQFHLPATCGVIAPGGSVIALVPDAPLADCPGITLALNVQESVGRGPTVAA